MVDSESDYGGGYGSVKDTTFDVCLMLASFFMIVILPLVVIFRKIYKNYSSLIMIVVLALMALNYLIMSILRLKNFFPDDISA